MRWVAPNTASGVHNVFVLMLENHSFDNIFAFSGIPNIKAATTSDSNSFGGVTYHPSSPAPWAMPTDPGHEFYDVLVQLCGPPSSVPPPPNWRVPWTAYNQPIDNSGFVYDYANSTTEAPADNPFLKPSAKQRGAVMMCFDTPAQLPIINALATNFAICDHWFSSLPGPTWPNRFFVHGASSGGWADSPGSWTMGVWEYVSGFTYPSGASIYDKLNHKQLTWRIYQDESGSYVGATPQVTAIKGVDDSQPFKDFAWDVMGPYPYAYTFIEPNYGDTVLGTYEGGSSQHPMDSMVRGEALIKATYEAIRRSPLWENSLLIITYDEHGGFYDSVSPGQAPPPNDGSPKDASQNKAGFLFDVYGVRVPAVIVSPQIQAGVDSTIYDHASVSATLNALFGTGTMTDRDAQAADLTGLLTGTLRTDCPMTLPPLAPQTKPGSGDDDLEAARPDPAVLAAQPLPEQGNAIGLLLLLAKRDTHLSGGDAAAAAAVKARVAAIRTRGDLADYAHEVRAKLAAVRAARSSGEPGRAEEPAAVF
ncbi:phosphoesterase [Caulobacter endophyticus]|uniref:Phosphoesterase n=2 Tax=Caulobacter endophyticus TaxID=2172652 RepID=A0A2T9K5D6_9CAUL|nr:phosphoesterase [Caulobacter endophyticus]